MALTPGGGRAPSAPPAPRPARDARDRPPTAAKPALSALRWGLLVGGLLIIADLTTRLVLQRAGSDATDPVAAVDEVLNGLLLVTAGISVQRETGRALWAVPAGLLAGFLDAVVVAAANYLNPPPGPYDPVSELVVNIVQGPVVALAAALISSFVRRRTGT